MPLYEYRCPKCDTPTTITRSINNPEPPPRSVLVDCTRCRHLSRYTRRFTFSFRPPLAEHWNRALNKPIHSMRQFREELKRVSEEQTLATGIEHNYTPVDMADTEALGVTNEGIDESNIARSRAGEPLLSEIPGAH